MTLTRQAKEAIKTALAMTAAYGAALTLGWDKPMWAGFAVAFVSLTTIGQSFDRAALRMVGTILAAGIALTLIAWFPQDRWLFMIFLSAWVGLCTYMMMGPKLQYFWQVGAFVCVIICVDAEPDAANAFALAALRAQETGLGILIYSLVTLLIWPNSSRDKFATAGPFWINTQRELFDAYRKEARGVTPAAVTEKLRAAEAQSRISFEQLLAETASDSYEVWEIRHSWRSFQSTAAGFSQLLEAWRDMRAEVAELELRHFIPELDRYLDVFDQRLASTAALLADQQSAGAPGEYAFSVDEAQARKLTPLQQVALSSMRTLLQQLDAQTRALLDCAKVIRGTADAPRESPAGMPRDRIVALDLDRLAGAARIMTIMWLAYLSLIYIDGLPGGAAVVTMATAIGIAFASMPQLTASSLVAPAAAGVGLASVAYILIMPHLSSFLGLGPLIFAVTFFVCYRFAEPKQVLGRALGLAMFTVIAAISNQQQYSFLAMVNTTLMFPQVILLIAVTAYVPISTRPERVFLRQLKRYFRSAEYLVRSLAHRRTPTLRERWLHAFHAHELATLPQKLGAWAPHVGTDTLSGAATESLQDLLNQLQTVSSRLKGLIGSSAAASKVTPPPNLQSDFNVWGQELELVFRALAAPPGFLESQSARKKFADMAPRLEADLVNALTSPASGNRAAGKIDAQTATTLFPLISGYLGLSEAVVALASKADAIDWRHWQHVAAA